MRAGDGAAEDNGEETTDYVDFGHVETGEPYKSQLSDDIKGNIAYDPEVGERRLKKLAFMKDLFSISFFRLFFLIFCNFSYVFLIS